MAPSAGTAGLLLRVSVTSQDRRLDVGVPGDTPLAELLPGFVRSLSELDPTRVHGGFRLTRADGSPLRPDASLLAQGVRDGELLSLVAGVDDSAPRVYDDVVEAVGDAVESQHRAWRAEDSARTALAASVTFFLASALLLLGMADSSFAVLIAGITGVLLLAVAAVFDRNDQGLVGRVLAMTASVFGAVAGYLAADSTQAWAGQLAWSGLGIAVAGAASLFAIREYREICLAPIGTGLVLALAGAIVTMTSDATGVLALTMAVVVTLGNGIPWLTVSSSQIKVVSPLSDLEIFDDPQPIDPASVTAHYNSGHRVLLSLRAAVAIIALVCVVPVAGSGVPGALLCALSFLGMMVGTRQTTTRADVITVMGTGIAGCVVTGLVAVSAHPEWRPLLIGILGATAALTVALALLSETPRLRLGRIADGVDMLALASLLPLGVVVAGLA